MFNPILQIADFGLSNLYHQGKFLQTFCGSPLYASPEIVNGKPYMGPEVSVCPASALSWLQSWLVFWLFLSSEHKTCLSAKVALGPSLANTAKLEGDLVS